MNSTMSIVKMILNESTGELEPAVFSVDSSYSGSKIKVGWSPVYLKEYDKVMMELNSTLEKCVFIYIRNKFTYMQESVYINQSDVAKVMGSTRATINRIVKKLISIGCIKKNGTMYRFNPFVYVPYRANAKKLQEEWNNGCS